MTQIELLAKGLFERFAEKKGKRIPNWHYLSEERQIEWMKEVIIHIEYLTKEIRNKLKEPPKPSKGEASYGLGFINGLQTKHLEFIGFLYDTEKDLKQQLEKIINPTKD